jgi:AAA15 family ATPase/GTPase
MKKIGFKNFRRFEEFPAIQLSPITFFVGRNNSGKSTFVKALLLINEYIKSDDIRKFSFANDVLNDVNIVTFGRAKNRNQPNNDGIEFSYLSGNHLIEILITGKDEDVAAKVLKLQVSDLKDGYYLQMFPGSDAVEVNIGKNRIESDQKVGDDEDKVFNMLLGEIAYFENRVLQLTKEREDSSNKKDGTYRFYLEAIDILNRLKQKRDLLIRNKERFESDDEDDTEISTHESNNGFEDKPFQEVEGIPFFDDTNVSFKNIVSDIIFEIEKCYNLVLQADDQNAFQNYSDEGLPQNYSVSLNNSDYILIFDEYDMYRKWSDAYFERNEIRSSFEKFFDSEFNNVIIYLGATSIKQSALFSIKDTENPLAKAINDYKQLKIDTNSASTANKFIKKWIEYQQMAKIK